MNKGLLVGFAVILVLLLGLPMMNTLKQNVGAPSATPASSEVAAPGSDEVAQPLAQLPPDPQPEMQASPPPPVPQMLTAQDLVGSAWEVNTQYGAIQVQLNAGGQATASHPMAGAMNGSWQVSGNQVVVTASFMNQTQRVVAQVCGTTLCVDGAPLRRLR
jgi:hypothetical protein